jgi:hypothetical protein
MSKDKDTNPKKQDTGGADPDLMNTFKKSEDSKHHDVKVTTRQGK